MKINPSLAGIVFAKRQSLSSSGEHWLKTRMIFLSALIEYLSMKR